MENLYRITGPFDAYWMKTQRARIRVRFLLALAFSLGFHALLLFLQLGDAGFGLPGLELPWAERRVQATDIAARLVELSRAPIPVPLTVLPYVPPAPPPTATPEIPKPPRVVKPTAPRLPRVARAVPPEAPLSLPRTETVEAPPVAEIPAPRPEVRPSPQPEILAQTEPQPDTFEVPETRPPEEEASRKSEVESRKLEEELARQRALAVQKELEAKKQEEASRKSEVESRKLEEELARQRALALQKELEAKKLEDAKKQEEALRLDIARKQEEARRIAVEAEALKRAEDAARQQAAARQKELEEIRRKAEDGRRKELEAQQQAEAKQKAEEAARAAAAVPAPGAPSGRELAGKALEQLRTPGAGQTPGVARVDPPRQPSLPGSISGPRRRSVFGVERDVVMRSYVDSWRWKIERFGALNYRPSAAWRARDNPVVTIAIRSDGSLESVHINQSSGVRELDETVRRIAQRYAPYSAFPPALALQYDVIEIRRVWFFDDTLKIMEEM